MDYLLLNDLRKVFDRRGPVVVDLSVSFWVFQIYHRQSAVKGNISSKYVHSDGHAFRAVPCKTMVTKFVQSLITFNRFKKKVAFGLRWISLYIQGTISLTAAGCKCFCQFFTHSRDFFPEETSFNLSPAPLVLYVCGTFEQTKHESKTGSTSCGNRGERHRVKTFKSDTLYLGLA